MPSPGTAPSIFPARSWLFAAKTRQGFVKAAQSNADVVVLDLEDSVPLEMKTQMREEYKRAIEDGIFSEKNVFVRVNEIVNKDELEKDIRQLTIPGVSGIIIPKIGDCSSLKVIEELVSTTEQQNELVNESIKFVPLVETAAGYFGAETIATASRRIVALMAGSADFQADCMCDEYSATYYALLSQVSISAKAAKLVAIAGPCEKLDPISSEEFYRRMKACGLVGAVTLNPLQTLQANIEFSYSPKEVQWARMVHSREGISTLQLSVQESRQIIGPPHHIKATNILQRQTSIDNKDKRQSSKNLTGNNSFPSNVLHGHKLPRGLYDRVKVGQLFHSPLEVTITESWKTLWESSFMTSNRLVTSAAFASKQELRSNPLPLNFLNALSIGLAVSSFSQTARVHLGCYNAVQQRPVYPGDTIRGIYQIDNARNIEANNVTQYTVVHSSHGLLNQEDQVVFTVRKRTMFAPLAIDRSVEDRPNQLFSPNSSEWKKHFVSKPADVLSPLAFQPTLATGNLLLHGDYKVFGKSETTSMCKLLKLTNPHHHNIVRYSASDILVPGPFVIAAMLSNAERDLGEVIYEEFPVHTNINKVNPGDQIGTVTYVLSIQQMVENPGLEEITLKHIGIKNVDLEWLEEAGIPATLFDGVERKPAEYEALCAEKCPLLYRKIACQAERKIIRVRNEARDRY